MSCFPNALRPISCTFIDSVGHHRMFIISIATDGSMRFLLSCYYSLLKFTQQNHLLSFLSQNIYHCVRCAFIHSSFIHPFSKYLWGPLCTPLKELETERWMGQVWFLSSQRSQCSFLLAILVLLFSNSPWNPLGEGERKHIFHPSQSFFHSRTQPFCSKSVFSLLPHPPPLGPCYSYAVLIHISVLPRKAPPKLWKVLTTLFRQKDTISSFKV